MSKFSEKLSRAAKGAAPTMGFGVGVPSRRTPPILLVAQVTGADRHLAAVKELADAVLLAVPHTIGLDEHLPPLIRGVGGLPLGVWLEALPESEIEAIASLGCDFVVFGGSGTSTAILRYEGLGKVLTVEPAMTDSMVGAIDQLEVDAVSIKAPSEEAGVSLNRLLLYQRFGSLISKPLMVPAPRTLTSHDLEHLLEAGVHALLVDVDEVGRAGLQQTRQAIGELPPVLQRRPTRTRAIVPQVPAPPTGEPEGD